MRTPEEMQAVYMQLAKKGVVGGPYVLKYQHKEYQIVFFGSRHSNDPDDQQFDELKKEWQQFMVSPTDKVVIIESLEIPKVGKSSQRAIIENGERGMMAWLAKQAGITPISAEPGRVEEIDKLHADGFSYEQILAYYFARQMHQWCRADFQIEPDWHKYIETLAKGANKIHNWGGLKLSPEKLVEIYEKTYGQKFDPEDIEYFGFVSDPYNSEVSAQSGHYRDEKLLEAIKTYSKKRDIFIVYGSGHTIRLEPVLNELYGPNLGTA